MKRTVGILTIIGGAVVASGCLQMESAHRLYLSPQGAVSWTVRQTEVRSDAEKAATRHEEEREWLAGIDQGSHPVALAFQALGGQQIQTALVRRERPYAAEISCECGRVDELANTMLSELQVKGHATLIRRSDTTTLTIEIQVPASEQEYGGALDALFDELEHYRIVLTAGRFVAADGFTISADGVIATPVAPAGATDVVRLSLTWAGD